MKYSLVCPNCGSHIPVTAGQAGQQVRCTCGHEFEVPSIRELRKLELVPEAEAALPSWSTRQGLLFLGLTVTGLALLVAGVVAVMRPSLNDRSLMELPINRDAIQREVNATTPAEDYLRFQQVIAAMPGYSELLAQGAVPAHLLPALRQLSAIEGNRPQPLAPKSTAELGKEAGQRNTEIVSRVLKRRAMNDWLLLIGIVGLVGVLLAGASLMFTAPKPARRPAVAKR